MEDHLVKKNGRTNGKSNETREAASKTSVPEVRKASTLNESLERFSQRVSQWSGSTWAFVIATALVLIWAVTGPIFDFSPDWQLVINTGTTIVTFLMVFLIQRAQNKESRAVQLKLNEIVAAMEGASNRLVGVEDLSEEELRRLHDRYLDLTEKLHRRGDITIACSVDDSEAHRRAGEKRGVAKAATG